MEDQITNIIVHMTKSHQEMAKIIEAKRRITVRVSQMIHAMPDRNLSFNDNKEVADHSLKVIKNITSYLNSLADLEDALAENLTHVVAELSENQEEKE